MADQSSAAGKIRLVYRRSSPLLKCAVMAVIVLSTVAILALRSSVLSTQGQTEGLRLRAAALEAENRQLTQAISELGTEDSVKRIAAQELGLVDPDSVFFEPVEENIPE